MGVYDSKADRDEAIARLSAATDESLRMDLEYWTVASYDHAAEYRELLERQAQVRTFHAEEEAWIGLIATEMRTRARARREAATP
jgi:hypothetical protein